MAVGFFDVETRTLSKKINIAIDGYSGTGKSSTAKAVASKLGYTYLDSGAMYRAVTYYFIQQKVNRSASHEVKEVLNKIEITFKFDNGKFYTCVNDQNVENQIRGMEVSSLVSEVSAIKKVREKLVAIQQELGENKGVVMDGRDIGTVVFPNAELKIFMTADVQVRAERRRIELEEQGHRVSLDQIIDNIKDRDKQDTSREASPLIKAQDAIEIDTTHLTFDEQVDKIVTFANQTSRELK
ncbi:MAG: (d)CMP kinase [Cyclobacteriaceae bacterium]